MASRVRKATSTALAGAKVVDLVAARERLRFEKCRGRIGALLDEHRSALTLLVDTGLMFTRQGTRIGRELLQAQQGLLRVQDQLSREARGTDARCHEMLQTLLVEVETVLEKSSGLVQRHRALFEKT